MSMSTGDVTSVSFRRNVLNENPSVSVENFNTQGQPSTLGGISKAEIRIIYDWG